MKKTDVCIVGAGPTGAFTALFLAKKGIRCTLIDKAVFPRDKICGDGISGWVLWVLQQLDKDLLLKLNKQEFTLPSHGIRIVGPNQKRLDLPFYDEESSLPGVPPGFICKRIHFDQFLMEEIKRQETIQLVENTKIIGWQPGSDGVTLEAKDGTTYPCQLVVFANGANSRFMKDPGGIEKERRHTMTGIKTYFSGVEGTHRDNYVELHFIRELLPGYLWIFPLPNGEANVGVGLDQRRIAKRKINLKKAMLHALETIPALADRFRNAQQIAPVQAFGLPLWDKRRKISGDRFLLAGDAASLIDPVTGEGIGHAALSGMYAAEQIERSVAQGNFSASFLSAYDDALYQKIGKELRISRNIPRFIQHPRLFNSIMNRATGSELLRDELSRAMTDLEARKKLKNPATYLKILLGF